MASYQTVALLLAPVLALYRLKNLGSFLFEVIFYLLANLSLFIVIRDFPVVNRGIPDSWLPGYPPEHSTIFTYPE